MYQAVTVLALVGQIHERAHLRVASKVNKQLVLVGKEHRCGVAVNNLCELRLIEAFEREGHTLHCHRRRAPCELCVLTAIINANVVHTYRSARIENVHTQALRLNRQEAKQALVANGCGLLTLLHSLPCAVLVEPFDSKFLHALSERNILLQHYAVHLTRLLEREGYVGRGHPVACCPVGVPRTIGQSLRRKLSSALVAHLWLHASHEVVAKLALNELMKVDSICRINGVYQSVAVYGEIEQQRGVVSHTTIVEVSQLLRTLHLVILLRVIEPSRTYGHVTLGCRPLVAIGIAKLQFGIVGIARIDRVLWNERPVGFASKALLVAHPSASRSTVAEHHRLWLQAIENLVDARIVVIVLSVDGAFVPRAAIIAVATVGTVEPHLKHGAIVGEQVTQLRVEIVDIRWRAIVGARAVPWREIDRKLQSVLLTSLRQFLHDVSFSIAPWRLAHVIIVSFKWPQAEAVMMFCRQDDALHAGSHERLHPLLTVEALRVKHLWVGVAISPFSVAERVETEMNEGVGLHALPVDLFLFG